MKLFNVEHIGCYVCGSINNVKMIDWELGNNGAGYGPVKSAVNQMALCESCRKELKLLMQNKVKKVTWEEMYDIAATMTKDEFVKSFIESKEELIVFNFIREHDQVWIDSDILHELAGANGTKVSDLKKAITTLKRRCVIYPVVDMPGYYGADFKFKE